jgi:ribA/ribD-fused uncharacterized protein
MTDLPIKGFYGEYRFLSNFWFAPQVMHLDAYRPEYDVDFNERWYMLNKTLFMEDRVPLLEAKTPQEAKRLGRDVRLREDWEEVKDGVMLAGLRAKFGQNPDLAQRLVDTHTRYLEETNTWNDTYWGVCRGRGRNMLGILLMQVRAELSMGSL